MTDVVMPQMGESIVEGTLTKWLKQAGDSVERDEPLFEISTDKVDTEIPSPAAGVLSEVLVEEGATVAVDTVVARIDESGDGAGAKKEGVKPEKSETEAIAEQEPSEEEEEAAEEEKEEEKKPAAEKKAPPKEKEKEPAPAAAAAVTAAGPISPLVRRMAREYNIDLSEVSGTGAGGRITKQDVEAYMASQGERSMAAPAPAAKPAAPAPAARELPPRAEQAKVRVEPMSNMRAKIAEHMVMSKQTSAHVTTVHRVDMTQVARIRDRHKSAFKERYGISLTYLPFVTRAAAQAVREFPLVNASIDGKNVLYHTQINIGIAVALENGLIVPVIRDADEKNVVGLQRAIADLAARARARQLKPDEVQGGTFSITNFGSFGSLFATPVINQPQVAILGVGSVEKMPVVVNDAIAIRSMAFLSLTFDHRLIDGAPADQFVGRVKHILENWSEDIL